MKSFSSPWRFQYPDVKFYEAQKGIHVIHSKNDEFPKTRIFNTFSLNGIFSHAPQRLDFYRSRIEAAVSGKYLSYLAFFPGHTLPGPGAGKHTQYVGSLLLEKFENLLQLYGGFPPVGPFKDEKQIFPPYSISEVPLLGYWPWKIEQPKLQQISPIHHPHRGNREEKQEKFFEWLKEKIFTSLRKHGIAGAFTLIRKIWSPNTDLPHYWEEAIVTTGRQLEQYLLHHFEEKSLLSFFFEIEFILSQLQNSERLNITSYGVFNGCWVEVGKLPIRDIRCTELAVTRRIVNELVNVRMRGFAPLIINEYLCEVDGTHRIITVWLFNLLQRVKEQTALSWTSEFQESVIEFMRQHEKEMGPLAVREVLRVLSEIFSDEETFYFLSENVFQFLLQYSPIHELPVTLLLEYQNKTVIKELYDDNEGAYRVNPVIYQKLAQDPALTLPARGPYHLTDRTILPWFDILFPRQ